MTSIDKRILLYILAGIICLAVSGCLFPPDSTGTTLDDNIRFHKVMSSIGVNWGYDCMWDNIDFQTCIDNGQIHFLASIDDKGIEMSNSMKETALHTHDIGVQFVYGMCYGKDLSIADCQDAAVDWISKQLEKQLK